MPDTATADAPGRVNLIGEHTDYHEGYVLPTVIPQRTRVHLLRRFDRHVCVRTAALAPGYDMYEAGAEERGRGWLDYVQGVTALLARAGAVVPGLDVRIESDVPLGAGVSSSAALEVSLLRGLRTLLGLNLDDVSLALLAQRVETEFVGAPVGVMDQMASSLGAPGEALFIDTRTLAVERVPLPRTVELVVIDSGITHQHAGGAYATRRQESFDAAARLGVERLRDIDISALDRIDALPSVLARRARHVVTENARVLAAVEALRAGDIPELGRLFAASHASMRDDYQVSTPDVDELVSMGWQHPHIAAARLTGGGFGGAVVMLAEAGYGELAARDVAFAYRNRTGQPGAVLVPPPTGTA